MNGKDDLEETLSKMIDVANNYIDTLKAYGSGSSPNATRKSV